MLIAAERLEHGKAICLPGVARHTAIQFMNLKLTDKTALVSGSTKGIGFAIATGLAGEGVRVIVNGRFAVQGSRFPVQGSRFLVQGSGFLVQGSGFPVQGSRFPVQSSRVPGSGG